MDLFSDESGLGVSTDDGRCNLSKLKFVDGKPSLENIFTFKAHMPTNCQIPGAASGLYPVHATGFSHRAKQFVFTAGGEGAINFWDFDTRNKIKTIPYNNTPVTAAKLSVDGYWLAYGLGYDWADGIRSYKKYKTSVGVHYLEDEELRHKG